ncbi:uncharacterized protein LOC127095309 [Lathyrus oleraceus]|uniref:uncharacterized protein LOC127095309 n=1 Tax=Pisum sativum TaxID=3888 RepID=UPI0021D0322F|nr:uncharacterized protein LOC127095309 [Pisum sativum]
MPFVLKNAGVTYQRAMATLFHDMMHKEIGVYVYDMIAKSKSGEDHVKYLSKLFQHLRKYKLRLNPNKCTFGVRSGKLLGFIVSQKGSEVDPDKMLLSEYEFDYHTLKAIKGNVLTDHLAHQPIDDYESINFEFPDEDVMYLKAKDCNELLPNEGPKPALTLKCTNNMAEYEACIMGLEEAIDLRIKNLDVYGDLALVVNQIKGEWKTR